MSSERLTLDPTYCSMLVEVFHKYPSLWDRSAQSWHKVELQTKDKRDAAREIQELESKMIRNGAIRSGKALFALNMQKHEKLEDQYDFLKTKWLNFLDHFTTLLKKVEEQTEDAKRKNLTLKINPSTRVVGRWSDWEPIYDCWLKKAVSYGNFGKGLSVGEELAVGGNSSSRDTSGPISDRQGSTPRSHGRRRKTTGSKPPIIMTTSPTLFRHSTPVKELLDASIADTASPSSPFPVVNKSSSMSSSHTFGTDNSSQSAIATQSRSTIVQSFGENVAAVLRSVAQTDEDSARIIALKCEKYLSEKYLDRLDN